MREKLWLRTFFEFGRHIVPFLDQRVFSPQMKPGHQCHVETSATWHVKLLPFSLVIERECTLPEPGIADKFVSKDVIKLECSMKPLDNPVPRRFRLCQLRIRIHGCLNRWRRDRLS